MGNILGYCLTTGSLVVAECMDPVSNCEHPLDDLGSGHLAVTAVENRLDHAGAFFDQFLLLFQIALQSGDHCILRLGTL